MSDLPTPGSGTNNRSTILVVEDDEAVRELAVETLRHSGYEVVEAADASAGLFAFESNPEIDLIFTDVILPGGVSGIEMSKQILNQNPDALIVLVTGYQEKGDALKDQAASMDNIAAIGKPYDIKEMVDLIGAMIGRRGS